MRDEDQFLHAFFRQLVRHLASTLGVRDAFVAECLPNQRARSLGFWTAGQPAENFEYDLEGTPCFGVLQGCTRFYPSGLSNLFPKVKLAGDRAPESYFGAMEWRYARGTFVERGPASVWMRMRMPLVEGEPISPLSRVLSAADSGNGISAELDFRTDLFINTDLTVHLFRMPEGEWVCIDAQTRQDANGIGVAQSVIWDEHRRIGAGAQALLIGSR